MSTSAGSTRPSPFSLSSPPTLGTARRSAAFIAVSGADSTVTHRFSDRTSLSRTRPAVFGNFLPMQPVPFTLCTDLLQFALQRRRNSWNCRQYRGSRVGQDVCAPGHWRSVFICETQRLPAMIAFRRAEREQLWRCLWSLSTSRIRMSVCHYLGLHCKLLVFLWLGAHYRQVEVTMA